MEVERISSQRISPALSPEGVSNQRYSQMLSRGRISPLAAIRNHNMKNNQRNSDLIKSYDTGTPLLSRNDHNRCSNISLEDKNKKLNLLRQ